MANVNHKDIEFVKKLLNDIFDDLKDCINGECESYMNGYDEGYQDGVMDGQESEKGEGSE